MITTTSLVDIHILTSIYSLYKPFISYVLCKYFITVCGFFFNFHNTIFQRAKFSVLPYSVYQLDCF